MNRKKKKQEQRHNREYWTYQHNYTPNTQDQSTCGQFRTAEKQRSHFNNKCLSGFVYQRNLRIVSNKINFIRPSFDLLEVPVKFFLVSVMSTVTRQVSWLWRKRKYSDSRVQRHKEFETNFFALR